MAAATAKYTMLGFFIMKRGLASGLSRRRKPRRDRLAHCIGSNLRPRISARQAEQDQPPQRHLQRCEHRRQPRKRSKNHRRHEVVEEMPERLPHRGLLSLSDPIERDACWHTFLSEPLSRAIPCGFRQLKVPSACGRCTAL